jgi:hypothetical protein
MTEGTVLVQVAIRHMRGIVPRGFLYEEASGVMTRVSARLL